ncbi:MAG: hypothetical protein WDM79_12520 [Terricaulis sp.]
MLQLMFGFHGRINRAQYWLSTFIVGIVGFTGYATLVLFMMQPGGAKSAAHMQGHVGGDDLGRAAQRLFGLGGLCDTSEALSRSRPQRLSDFNPARHRRARHLLGDRRHYVERTCARGRQNACALHVCGMGGQSLVLHRSRLLAGVDGPNKYGNPPGSPPSLTPQRGGPSNEAGTPSLGNAEAAMQRALASRDRNPQLAVKAAKPQNAPQPIRPAPALAPVNAAPSFGRRVAR